eukprot:2207091-Rhodomonas_salina.4
MRGFAAGDAVSSNCLRYELSGAIVLVLLGLSVVWFVALVFWAIRKRKAIWVGASVRETWGAMREQWAEARTRESVLKRLQGYYDAYLVLYTRGDWEQMVMMKMVAMMRGMGMRKRMAMRKHSVVRGMLKRCHHDAAPETDEAWPACPHPWRPPSALALCGQVWLGLRRTPR